MALVRTALAALLLAAGLVLLAPPGPAVACSCAVLTPDEQVDIASTVFSGTLVERDERERQVVYGFEVDRVFKGSTTRTTRVRTGEEEAACGLPNLTEGEDYIVLAAPVREESDQLFVSLCGGTRGIGGAGDTDRIEAVTGPGRAPDPGGPRTDDDEPADPFVPYWVMGGLAAGVVGALAALLVRRRRSAG